ncbi:MAG: hypothetical protein KBH94_06155 [Caldisericia bacterium]|nr:hypothetical protein [Caldisericia bacterium]
MDYKHFEKIYDQIFEKLPDKLMTLFVSTNNLEKDFLDRNGEFYSVSDFLSEELRKRGADIRYCFDLNIWGRKRGSCYVLNDDLLNEIAEENNQNN